VVIRRSRSAIRTAVSACWTAPAAPPVDLFFGRNEERGLRCVYHGWKFDVEGNVMDMPAEPSNSPLRKAVKIKSCR